MSYRKGAYFERRVKRYFEERGYFVVRSAGSHGIFDLVAVCRGEVLGIQCKVDGRLGAKEKEAMVEAAERYGIKPLLARREGRRIKIEEIG